jgi:uncharacterized phage-associated protein
VERVMVMASVFDVAKYILNAKGEMSTWKLQKLCYYSQAWHIAWTEKILFNEKFEAWANGPVCPALYYEHKGQFSICSKDIKGYPEHLTDDERETVDIILRDYGDMDPYSLRELSHHEDPWKNARGDLKEGERCTTEITPDAMGLYYGSL